MMDPSGQLEHPGYYRATHVGLQAICRLAQYGALIYHEIHGDLN